MKKILAILTAVSAVLCLSACNGNQTSSEDSGTVGSESSSSSSSSSVVESKPESQTSPSDDEGRCSLEYKACRIVNYNGKETVVLDFDFSTGLDEKISFLSAVTERTVTQDGEALGQVFMIGDNSSGGENNLTAMLAPGSSASVSLAYVLNDLESPITIMLAGKWIEKPVDFTLDITGAVEEYRKASEENNSSDSDSDVFAGDWVGAVEFSGCTGEYEGLNGSKCEIIARFAPDGNGGFTPYIALSTDGIQLSDISVFPTTANYVAGLEMNGKFLGQNITEGFVAVDNGFMNISVKTVFNNGDTVGFVSGMRHIGDEWDYENDYPRLTPDGVNSYNNKTLYEIAESYGKSTDNIPPM